MDDLFAPPAEDWQPIAPQWKSLRRLTTVLFAPIVFTIAAVLIGLLSGQWWISGIVWALVAVIVVIRLGLTGRSYRSWGYALRDDDLFITHGWFYRNLIAVPYGRMQAVEVTSGPLERAFGLATVQLITASPQSNAQIVGLTHDEAVRLRDRLTRLGETQASGL